MKLLSHGLYVLTAMVRGLLEALVVGNLSTRRQRSYWEWRLRREARQPSSDGGAVIRRHGALAALAVIEVASGEFEKAATYYREAVDAYDGAGLAPRPKDGWFLLHYAEVLSRLGRLTEARGVWERIVRLPEGADDLSRECRRVALEHLRAHPGTT